MSSYHPELVQTYTSMRQWRDRFYADDGLQFLIIVGPPGDGKSFMFTAALPPGAVYLSGDLSAPEFYAVLCRNRNRPFVIDDIDTLLADRAIARLLKCLCNIAPVRTVYWNKQNRDHAKEGIPRSFTTTSRICIILNEIKAVQTHLAPVLDRAFVLAFEPPVAEVHREVDTWFDDEEVYGFIGEHLDLITKPSMRLYAKAQELKKAGGDWKGWLKRHWGADDQKLTLVGEIMNDERLTNARDRADRFAELGGGSRATFMRYLAKWRALHGRDGRAA